MKNPFVRINRGFTLVELLVVIAIVVVLAGAGFSAGGAAIQKAKKTTCLAAATGIETAVNNFYTEYGSMPTDGEDDEIFVTDEAAGIDLLKTLLGEDKTLNPRGIKFLSANEGKANKNGLIYNSSGTEVTAMFDPWGGPYNVILDLNYDEKLEAVQPKGAGNKPSTLNGRRVAVWSDGADGVSASGKAADDVKTWGL
jgi:prepilin-type N-terminal cleavage/methylation domain-containing protein